MSAVRGGQRLHHEQLGLTRLDVLTRFHVSVSPDTGLSSSVLLTCVCLKESLLLTDKHTPGTG